MSSTNKLLYYLYQSASIRNMICLLLLLKLIQVLWQRRRLYYLSWQLPGPIGFPLIGSLLNLFKGSEELLTYINHVFAIYGSVMKIWLGPILLVEVSDPRDVQIITTSPDAIEKPIGYRFADMWLGNGLFIAKGCYWREQRKMIEQTFNVPVLDSYMNVFNWESVVLVNQVKQHCDTNEYVDMWPFTCRCTLDIVGQTMLGVKFNCQLKNEKTNDYDNEYVTATAKAFKIILKRVIHVWLMKDTFFKRSALYQEFMKCLDVFYGVTDAVIGSINNREEFLKQQGLENQRTMIDELFRDNKANNLTNKDLQDHLNTMVATGADATGNAVAIFLVLIAIHPEIQERLFHEIMDNLDDPEADFVSRSCVNKMTYLDYAIKESLRIFPGSSLVARFTTNDIKLASQDITICKGVAVLIGIGALHRRRDIWGEDADQFNPDRFATHNKRHPYSFAAFSVGPRNCVGYKYAMLSMKVIVVHLLRRYRFSTDEKFEDLRFYINLMSKKVGGCRMKIHSR